MGWEYFNSLPAGRDRPWEWAKWMTTMLRSHCLPNAQSSSTSQIAEVVQTELVEEADPYGPNSKDAPLPEAFDYDSEGLEWAET